MKSINIAVDNVIFVFSGTLSVLLIQRASNPFKGMWAIPGGFVEPHEPLKKAARRELHEETGVKNISLQQLHCFGDPNRDPRSRIISIAYLGLTNKIQPRPGSDASKVKLFPYSTLPRLSFDHKKIILYAFNYLKSISIVELCKLLPEKFTLTQLQSLLEEIYTKKLDKRNFRKKISKIKEIKPTNQKTNNAHRPATLHRVIQLPQ